MMKKRKKTRIKYKNILVILLIGGLIIFGSYKLFYNKPDDKTKEMMKEQNIDIKKYSKTLEYVLLNNIYNEEYLDEYEDIEYTDQKNFSEILTTFLPKGYSGKEINYFFNLSEKNIDYLKNQKYKDISNYYKISNFDASKLDRYNNYHNKNENLRYDVVVTRVNIQIDLPAYTETKEVKDADSLLVLVNKYNHLPSKYKPGDLAYVTGAYGNEVPMRSIAKENLLLLMKAAKKEININLLPTTAFRNESFQKTLYDKYVARDGKEAADTYSARPGYSEHQTGLAIDLKNTALKDIRLTDENYKWLEQNAYKYGFIIRFPKGKENITGYQFENWHIRYVGKDVAKTIYDNKLTLEEYIDLYVTKY